MARNWRGLQSTKEPISLSTKPSLKTLCPNFLRQYSKLRTENTEILNVWRFKPLVLLNNGNRRDHLAAFLWFHRPSNTSSCFIRSLPFSFSLFCSPSCSGTHSATQVKSGTQRSTCLCCQTLGLKACKTMLGMNLWIFVTLTYTQLSILPNLMLKSLQIWPVTVPTQWVGSCDLQICAHPSAHFPC